jgi:hypothetical protein
MADPREEAIRRHYYQPRSLMAEKAAGSRAGQAYHTMTSLQDRMASPDYATDEADTDQLKAIRRDWNREQKYTPMGMNVSGATSPLDAQNRFMGTTETFRQASPQAYGTMYPLSQAAMKLGEYGGLMGLGIRALTGKLGKTIRERFPENVPIIEKSATDELIPPLGIANLVPEYQRQKELFDINETVEGGEGIFGTIPTGRGDLPSAFDYEELRRKRRLPYKLEEALRQIEEASIEEFGDDTKELPEDKKTELEALLLSPEFQALPQHEKERILLEDYGVEIKTGIQ